MFLCNIIHDSSVAFSETWINVGIIHGMVIHASWMNYECRSMSYEFGLIIIDILYNQLKNKTFV